MGNKHYPIITDQANHYMPPCPQSPAHVRKLPRILTISERHPDRARYFTALDIMRWYYVSDCTALRWMRHCPASLVIQIQDGSTGVMRTAVPRSWLIRYALDRRGYPPPPGL